ncbi:MAG TPA: LysM peptidoglycan-binding domain-containing protein [Solirubrobacteraceae bacterium]|nr:LysM peptidoglycan-binding domain-containing protein [Solirubrobacteraceae bacterium]
MSRSPLLVVTAALALLPAAPAAAAIHEVAPGETLSGIAIADGLPLSALAAANGISAETRVVAGQVLTIPAAGDAATATATATTVSGDGDGDADDGAGTTATTATAPPALGAYTVRPGDTLSELAVRSRVPAAQIAYMNGLSVDGPLLTGTIIKLPTGSPVATTAASAPSTPTVVPAASPTPTTTRLTASEISSIASANGVPGSLAAAIAWQESGFNNAFVSSANARGVMQLLPGTWDYVQSALIPGQHLDPASASDNVRAGSLYLGQLLRQSGGDAATAVAGYYQGLASVRSVGMLPETRRYVADVLALQGRFGG